MATFSTYLMYVMLGKLNIYVAFVLTLFISFIYGSLLHVFIIRKIRARAGMDTEFVAMIITLGLMSIFGGLSRLVGGATPVVFPSMFPEGQVTMGSVVMSYRDLGIIFVTVCFAVGLSVFFRYSRLGLGMEGAADNKLAASLRGIRIDHILTLSWGISSVIGTISGVLFAPVLGLSPGMLSTIFIIAYTASVIGGLKSPIGTLVGGVIVGVVENLSGTVPIIGSQLKTVAVFIFLVAVLYFRPRGLFGRTEIRKV